MRTASIVAPKPVRGLDAEKVIYIPCDIPSRLLSTALKRQAQAQKGLEHGLLYKLGESAVLFQALGSPVAALALESLIASGAKKIILLGFCGSLSKSFTIADAVSISQALSEEGTSRLYFSKKRTFPASLALKKHLDGILRSSGLPFKTGTIVSTDAPFRETKSWLRKNQNRGAELVDMETSAVFALAEFHGIEAASLQLVSDELWSGKWKTGFSSSALENRVKDYFLPLLIP
jgi:purine-nucleoside phosphorylase